MEFEGKLSTGGRWGGQRELKREQVIERDVHEDSTAKRRKKERKHERGGGVGGGVGRGQPNLNGGFKKVTGTLFLPINIFPLLSLGKRQFSATPASDLDEGASWLQKERMERKDSI